jgi:hypothetical protein
MAEGPGRGCPVSYRYGAKALRAQPTIDAETLYVAGGLYGNPFALEALLAIVAGDPGAKLVFNGDFNWFDVDAEEFRHVNETVLEHWATRGNVETELAQPAKDAGCGCGYPDWVGDAEVLRSNRIQERLRATALAQPGLTARLGALPMCAIARVGALRVGIVHGDADSLAGWGFSQQALATPEGLAAACDAFAAAGVGVIASSHTCLPVLQRITNGPRESVVINNGAAGMPNFRGTTYGLVTRISLRAPAADAIYGVSVEGTHVHAIPVRYDTVAWKRSFLDHWPSGSDAYQSYYGRICDGPAYAAGDALRLVPRQPAVLAL